MFMSLKSLCQILTAVTFVQASHLSSPTKDQNGSKSRVVRSPQWNATAAESKAAVVKPTTSSIASSIIPHPLQHVELDLSTATVVQNCGNGNGTTVVQDCTCSTQQLASQAINDAITMVNAVKAKWSDVAWAPILQQYMGGSSEYPLCQTEYASGWITGKLPKRMAGCKHSQRIDTLENLASISEYRWQPYDPLWLSGQWGTLSELFAYCASGNPPPERAFSFTCPQGIQDNSPFGWVYTKDGDQVCLPPKAIPFRRNSG